MAETLTEIPSAITSGTTVRYTATRSDYPANAGWSLKLYLAGLSVTDAIVGVASGASFVFTLTPEITRPLKPGLYQWRELASKAGDVYVAAQGTVQIEPDITAAGAGDMLSQAQRELQVCELAILGRLTDDLQSFQIAGRMVAKIPITELIKIRDALRDTVRAEKHSGRWGQEVRVQFTGVE